MATLSVKYDLKPPGTVDAGVLQAVKETATDIATDPKDQSKYYAELRRAVLQTKDALGEDLTQWRDAVGKAELNKETMKSLKDEDEEDEEDGESRKMEVVHEVE